MGLASKEKLWQVSLLLVEHLKRTGLVPGKFVYDEICSVSFTVLIWLEAERVVQVFSVWRFSFDVFAGVCFFSLAPQL